AAAGGGRPPPVLRRPGPRSHPRPPGPLALVSISPALLTFPAPGVWVKRIFPARKSASDRFRLEATKPATSIRPVGPITTPLGLSRNTRPPTAPLASTDWSSPSIWLCGIAPLAPTTRFKTAEELEDWTNFVISLTPIEKLCQLMMALAELVTVRVLPEEAKLALPELTVPPVGLASACVPDRPKQAATDSAISFGLVPICAKRTAPTATSRRLLPASTCKICVPQRLVPRGLEAHGRGEVRAVIAFLACPRVLRDARHVQPERQRLAVVDPRAQAEAAELVVGCALRRVVVAARGVREDQH